MPTLKLNGVSDLWMRYHVLKMIIIEAWEKGDPRVKEPIRQATVIGKKILDGGQDFVEGHDRLETEDLRVRHAVLMAIITEAEEEGAVNIVATEQCRQVVEEIIMRGELIEPSTVGLDRLVLTARAPKPGSSSVDEPTLEIEYVESIDDEDTILEIDLP